MNFSLSLYCSIIYLSINYTSFFFQGVLGFWVKVFGPQLATRGQRLTRGTDRAHFRKFPIEWWVFQELSPQKIQEKPTPQFGERRIFRDEKKLMSLKFFK
jgi:hypothetical protein